LRPRPYPIALRGTDHHTTALNGILNGDGDATEAAIIADITEAANYLAIGGFDRTAANAEARGLK
jgi:hypothetical protein